MSFFEFMGLKCNSMLMKNKRKDILQLEMIKDDGKLRWIFLLVVVVLVLGNINWLLIVFDKFFRLQIMFIEKDIVEDIIMVISGSWGVLMDRLFKGMVFGKFILF